MARYSVRPYHKQKGDRKSSCTEHLYCTSTMFENIQAVTCVMSGSHSTVINHHSLANELLLGCGSLLLCTHMSNKTFRYILYT